MIEQERLAATGEVIPVLRARGEPPVECSLLLLDKEDVRFRRLGLWGVRSELASRLPEPLRGVLTQGRSGVIEAAATG